jgi:Rieske Fe-S protein
MAALPAGTGTTDLAAPPRTDTPPSRRGVLTTVAAVGAAAGGLALAGCSSSGSSGTGAAAPPADTGAPAAASTAGAAAPAAGGATAAGAGTVLGDTAQIPVGGGKIFPASKVVVTQPTAGTFKAFSSTCTHQQCQVTSVSGGQIGCPCHGAKFSVNDGSVVGGPAPTPLPAAPLTVDGTSLVLGAQ